MRDKEKPQKPPSPPQPDRKPLTEQPIRRDNSPDRVIPPPTPPKPPKK